MKTENQQLAIEIVNQLIEMGAPVWAVGPEHFVVTDCDLPEGSMLRLARRYGRSDL